MRFEHWPPLALRQQSHFFPRTYSATRSNPGGCRFVSATWIRWLGFCNGVARPPNYFTMSYCDQLMSMTTINGFKTTTEEGLIHCHMARPKESVFQSGCAQDRAYSGPESRDWSARALRPWIIFNNQILGASETRRVKAWKPATIYALSSAVCERKSSSTFGRKSSSTYGVLSDHDSQTTNHPPQSDFGCMRNSGSKILKACYQVCSFSSKLLTKSSSTYGRRRTSSSAFVSHMCQWSW
jgi:hypothetical protein